MINLRSYPVVLTFFMDMVRKMYEDEEAERSWNAFIYCDSDQEVSTDPPMQGDSCDVECPSKKAKDRWFSF